MTKPGKYALGDLLDLLDEEEDLVSVCYPGSMLGFSAGQKKDSLIPAELSQNVMFDGNHISTVRGGRVLYDVYRDLGIKGPRI